MNPKTIIAALLIVLGIVAFVYQGISYTTRGREVNIGALHMTTEKTHRIPLPPIIGAIALIGGIGLLLVDRRSLGSAVGR